MPITTLDIANRALLRLGAKYVINSLSEDTDRARVCNIEMDPCRLETLRAHPWHHARRRAKLTSKVAGILNPGSGATILDNSGVSFTLTGVADGFLDGRDEDFVLVGNSGRARITSVVSPTEVLADIDTAFADLSVISSGDWRFSPLWEYDYRYALPTDYLRSWDVQPTSLRGIGSSAIWWRGITTDVYASVLKREGDFLMSSDGPAIYTAYTADRQDLNTWDPLSISAYVGLLCSRVAYGVTGSLQVVKTEFDSYRAILAEARSMDGQEGTPDDSGSDMLIASRMP
jgi:hypothetical protein